MVVVEVRQGTLSGHGRGWGPAGNTVDRGSQLDLDDADDKEDEEDEEDAEEEDEAGGGRRRRRTRRRRKEEEDEEEEEEAEATNIKSNNPHLAGGEKRAFRLGETIILDVSQNSPTNSTRNGLIWF